MPESKIYQVIFKEPTPPDDAYFFGSLAAIYDTFTDEQIGCKLTRLWAVKIEPGNPYSNKKCTISQETLIRKKGKRGVK